MPPRLDAALDRRLGNRPGIAKFVRYSAASAAGVVSSQIVLLVCVIGFDIAAEPSNVIAVTAGALPNYLINRAWTFNKRGSHSLTREVLPFWGMAFLGLILSTFTVGWADDRFDGNPLALMAANIAAFGALWVARFVVLDRVLFAPLVEFVEQHEDADGHLHLRAEPSAPADTDAAADPRLDDDTRLDDGAHLDRGSGTSGRLT